MDLLFGGDFDYGRGGLALVALGMGCHLAAGTLNQAALARGRQRAAAAAWAVAAVGVRRLARPPGVDDELLRVEIGYLGATALLCALLAVIDRRRRPSPEPPRPRVSPTAAVHCTSLALRWPTVTSGPPDVASVAAHHPDVPVAVPPVTRACRSSCAVVLRRRCS